METSVIIAIVVVVALIALFLLVRAGGIGLFKGSFRARRGYTEIGGDAEIRGAQPVREAGTVVKGTKMIGKKQKMRVAKDNARIEDTLMKGKEQEFIVDNDVNESSQSEHEEQS